MTRTPKSRLFNLFLPGAALIICVLGVFYNFQSRYYYQIPAILIPLSAAAFLLNNLYQKSKKEHLLNTELEDMLGKINLAYQQLETEEARNKSLRHKIRRYDILAVLIERLNQNLSLEETVNTLVESAYSLLGQGDSSCLLYLSEGSSDKLYLAAADKNSSIKEKYGDMFDEWLIKHSQPLLVEDTLSDFRFDSDKFRKSSKRGIGSIISCCLVSRRRPIGLLRLDNPAQKYFGLEELRLLNTIADIASIAVDNSKYYQHIKDLAATDSLTHLYTRRFILERLEEEIKRSLITERPVSIIMLDIDFFKQYNDQYGHLAGDIVLRNLSLWLKEALSGRDYLGGRIGGEEFLVILASKAKEKAFSIAEEIRACIQEKTVNLRRKPSKVTVSAGVAGCPQDARTIEDLMNKADIALYEAKRSGRNRVCLF